MFLGESVQIKVQVHSHHNLTRHIYKLPTTAHANVSGKAKAARGVAHTKHRQVMRAWDKLIYVILIWRTEALPPQRAIAQIIMWLKRGNKLRRENCILDTLDWFYSSNFLNNYTFWATLLHVVFRIHDQIILKPAKLTNAPHAKYYKLESVF